MHASGRASGHSNDCNTGHDVSDDVGSNNDSSNCDNAEADGS